MKGTNALIVLAALTVAGGCAGGSSPRTSAGASPAARPATTINAPRATATGTPIVASTHTATAWSTTPTAVTHNAPVPPLPVVRGIRYAAHADGFDRIVLDIPGSLPGYSAKYVPEVRRDGSDEPVSMPGEAFLLIVLHPAQAHLENGTPTVSGTHRTGLAGIKAYAVVGDYEGYVSIALGVNGVRKYHVGELKDRIYIDVAV